VWRQARAQRRPIRRGQGWIRKTQSPSTEGTGGSQRPGAPYEPKRLRRLLLHKAEIAKLQAKSEVDGCTLVALRMYWKDAKVKVEIGVGKGKVAQDKRQDIKARTEKREADRVVAAFNRKRNG